MTKDVILTRIFELLRKLQNDHQVPAILAIYSKNGVIPYGSKNLVTKFNDILNEEQNGNDESWIQTFHLEQESILGGERLDEDGNAYINAQMSVLPGLLPAPIDLMVYNEIHPIVSREILKWYWRQGGTYKSVHYGAPEFNAEFWPDSWQWDTVTKNLKNIKKMDYRGPINMNLTEFFRNILQQILLYYSIDPDTHISKKFTVKNRRNRERYRGIHRAPVVEERARAWNEEGDLNESSDDEESEGGTEYEGGTDYERGNEHVGRNESLQ